MSATAVLWKDERGTLSTCRHAVEKSLRAAYGDCTHGQDETNECGIDSLLAHIDQIADGGNVPLVIDHGDGKYSIEPALPAGEA